MSTQLIKKREKFKPANDILSTDNNIYSSVKPFLTFCPRDKRQPTTVLIVDSIDMVVVGWRHVNMANLLTSPAINFIF
jgi:hypothetical protein